MSITDLKNKINPILKQNGVKKAAVFGSYARGEETKRSDVDILIEYENDNEISFLDVIGLKLELEKKLKKRVDLVEYCCIKERIKDRILSEQILIL